MPGVCPRIKYAMRLRLLPALFSSWVLLHALAWPQLTGELATNAELCALKEFFQTNWNVELRYGSTPAVEGVTYYADLGPGDAPVTLRFMRLMEAEYGKYPAGLIRSFDGLTVVLVKDFNAAQAGTGGVRTHLGQVFYAIGSLDYRRSYPRQLIHHELFHAIDLRFTGGDSPTLDRNWETLQPPGHSWGGGGSKYIRLGLSSANAYAHPFTGFVSFYATALAAEDKAVTWEYLCVEETALMLRGWLAGDPYLVRKVAALKRFARELPVPLDEAFWISVTNHPADAGVAKADIQTITGTVRFDGEPVAEALVCQGASNFIWDSSPTALNEVTLKALVRATADDSGIFTLEPAKSPGTPWLYAWVDANGDGRLGPGDLISDLYGGAYVKPAAERCDLALKRVCGIEGSFSFTGIDAVKRPSIGCRLTPKISRLAVFYKPFNWAFPDFSGSLSVLILLENPTYDGTLGMAILSGGTVPAGGGAEGSTSVRLKWVRGSEKASTFKASEVIMRP